MSLERLVLKYIGSAEYVLSLIEVESPAAFDLRSVRNVVDSAKAYLADAKYYVEKRKFEVGLASVAYCEGLLDALKLLGAVKFEWPTKLERTSPSRE